MENALRGDHRNKVVREAETAPRNLLILGLGNTLLGDEGAGVHVVHRLRNDVPEDVRLLDGGTLSFSLLEDVETAAAIIVIDAAELDAPPGTVRVFEGEAMDRFLLAGRCRSVHEVSLLDLFAMVRLRGRLPGRRALVGIQPLYVDWSESPSEAVAGGIEAACVEVRQLAERWVQ